MAFSFTITGLNDSYEILEHVRIHNPGNTIIESQFKNIYSFCIEMGWIKEKNDKLFLTNRGEEIHSSRSPNYLRLQLEDYIGIRKPLWADYLKEGPIDNQYSLPSQVHTILEAAQLMGRDFEKMEWLDRFIIAKYEKMNANKLKIGREGERLIYHDEHKRTKIKPEYWGDIEKMGYDIKSKRKMNGGYKDILIEVKAGNKDLENIEFHLSHYQWSTSFSHSNDDYYIFVVSIPDKKYLKITTDILKKYVPKFPKEKSVNWTGIQVSLSEIFKDSKSSGIDLDKNIIDLL